MTFEEIIENIAEEVKDDWWHEYSAELVVDTFKEKLIDNKDNLQEVKHGEWIPKDVRYREPFARNYICSICGANPIGISDYCPHCGARMGG